MKRITAVLVSLLVLPLSAFADFATDIGAVQTSLTSDVGTASAVAFALAALVVVADVTIKWFKKYAKKGT